MEEFARSVKTYASIKGDMQYFVSNKKWEIGKNIASNNFYWYIVQQITIKGNWYQKSKMVIRGFNIILEFRVLNIRFKKKKLKKVIFGHLSTPSNHPPQMVMNIIYITFLLIDWFWQTRAQNVC